MKSLPRIIKVLKVEPFKITCLWTTGEIRIADFEPKFERYRATGNERLLPLSDYEKFKQVVVGEDQTLRWESILVKNMFRGQLVEQSLALDPDVLYQESELVEISLKTRVSYLLKEARLEAGFTQDQLASRSGMTKSYISRVENGKSDFQLDKVERIFKEGLNKKFFDLQAY